MIWTLKLRVKGIVQGVGLRFSTQYKAQSLGLKGYVKNLPEGDVEIEAQGEKENLKELLLWLKSNPGSAQVLSIEEKWYKDSIKYNDFKIEY